PAYHSESPPVYSPASLLFVLFYLFFFYDTATTEIYTLSLHDARSDLLGSGKTEEKRLSGERQTNGDNSANSIAPARRKPRARSSDRKSTRLNSSHVKISYAVFCLKKKKYNIWTTIHQSQQ